MHTMSKVDFTLEEQDTFTVSKKPTTVITVHETFRTTEQATVYVKDLDMCPTSQGFSNRVFE